MKTLAILFVALASGCGPVEEELVESDEASIQGGRVDKDDPAVGMLWMEGGGYCTGTLIAPDIVLTAAHCVTNPVEGFYTGAGKRVKEMEEEPVEGLKRHEVVGQLAHPSYSMWGGCPNRTFDVGLVRLKKPIKIIKSLPLAEDAPAYSSSCRTVGYGVHNDDVDSPVWEQKRQAKVWVKEIGEQWVNVVWRTGISDKGDSGGPLLCNEKIAAVTSCKKDGSYPNHRASTYARVDNIAKWIDHSIRQWH
jgi:hypothetical protein